MEKLKWTFWSTKYLFCCLHSLILNSLKSGLHWSLTRWSHFLMPKWPQVNTGRELSPNFQQKIGLKIYWAWPRPSEQDPVSPCQSFPEASISLLSFSIRGQFSSVQWLSRVRLFLTPWTSARQASMFITNSWSSLKLTSIKLVMPSSHLILCCPLLLLPPLPPSIRVFSNESTHFMRWPKYWNFSFSISPSNEHPGLVSFRMDWLDLLAVQGTLKSLLQHHIQKHQFFCTQLSL